MVVCHSKHDTLNKLRHILAGLLSLLIVYTGAGVAIAHYCCMKCEVEEVCCQAKCEESPSSCEEYTSTSTDAIEQHCCDLGCSTVFYKIDLVKEASVLLSVPSFISPYCQLLPEFSFTCPVRDVFVFEESESPPVPPRCYLALYSTLLI